MILPPGHHQQVTSKRQFSRLERWLVGGMIAVVAVVAVVTVISLAGPSQTTARGCVDVSILGATGAAALHQCGGNARALCRSAGQASGYTGETAKQIRAACRKDGFAIG